MPPGEFQLNSDMRNVCADADLSVQGCEGGLTWGPTRSCGDY